MTSAGPGAEAPWPELTLAGWADTRDTLHLWTQVVGKVRFALEPMVNHWWQVRFCPDWVQHIAYSHELSSCGFWPDGSAEGSFYAYAYPTPAGFAGWPVDAPAFFDDALGEFLLPYAAVRAAADPDRVVGAFPQSTYEAAADLAGWDRATLEVRT